MPRPFTREDVVHLLHDRSNWGRWGKDDEVGAVNLITAEKRVAAASLVRSGRSVSLSRPFPTLPAANNPYPAAHYMKGIPRDGGAGGATDYYGIQYHGFSCTHIDALCHTWDERGMWNGRSAANEIKQDGARWAGIQNWKTGLTTRGVLLDVPAFRGEAFVRYEAPVHGDELEAIAKRQNIVLEPGDAIIVYCGRAAWDQTNALWGGESTSDGAPRRAGLHASCLEFVRDSDCAVLGWDMQDLVPNEWGLPWTVHGAIHSYGVAVVDNCELEPLAAACAEEGRSEFMLVLAPLRVTGGTGSPVNPLALF
jgi:kynurenine formamidase